MGMSNAERQRKFRQNRDNNPTKREEYLKKEKERYQKNKQLGKRKCVATMSEREHRAAKKKWRNEKRKTAAEKKLGKEKMETPNKASSVPAQTSRQKTQSLKKKHKEMAQCYRDNSALKKQLETQMKKTEMYRKRWVRALDKMKSDASVADTPRTKTRKLLRNCSKKYVRKTLIFHNAMIDQIKENYGHTQKKGVKRTLSSLLSGSVLKKYKVKTMAFQQCGIDIRNNLKKKSNLSSRLCKPVRDFYERDDVSRITTGLKRTITFKKIKKQRRILNDTLLNLHLKFLSETNTTVSYSTFCRLRPFWVVFPNESDRNTCLCKLCENTQFMCDALKKSTAIETDNLNKIIEGKTCDINHMSCMFADCDQCKHNRIEVSSEVQDEEVQWSEWTLRNEKRMIKVGKKIEEKTITLTVKETKEGTIADLAEKFEDQVKRYQKHLFLIKNQYSYYRMKKQSLEDNEAIIHIDFSENYVCKMASEIQSMHFGASKKQISLHTGIFITKNNQQSFCTVSENLNHGPAAIWAHLDPILKCLKKEHPKTDTIEFFSDGPTTQYRQKGNFYLASVKPQQYGFKNITWNFLESGHGKGIPDAIGGALKRNADQQIKYGKDIITAQQFVNYMRKSETKCFLIAEKCIVDEQRKLEGVELKAIPGTMKLHQMMFLDKIFFREISCKCKIDNECTGHKMNCSEVRKDVSCSTKLSNKSKKKTTNHHTEKTEKSLPAEKATDENPAAIERPTDERSINSTDKTYFSQVIKDLKACKSFKQLTTLCNTISKCLKSVDAVATDVSIMTHSLDVDANAMDSYPNDVPDSRALYPCLVPADGNCLPSCGSIYAFGSTEHADEIRVRIVTELVCNEDWYLNADCLRKGTNLRNTNLPKIYAQYSDMFIPGVVLTDHMIRNIYELEVMKIRQDKAYMGIWQVHALSSILKVPLYSIYPKMGNPNVRLDLNRMIIPREHLPGTEEHPVYILWTSNRHKDMTHEHWVPNHFVVVVPIDHSPCPGIMKKKLSELELSDENHLTLNKAAVEKNSEQKSGESEGQKCVGIDKKEYKNEKACGVEGSVEMDMSDLAAHEEQEFFEMDKKAAKNEAMAEEKECVEMNGIGDDQTKIKCSGQDLKIKWNAAESEKGTIDCANECNKMNKEEGKEKDLVEGHEWMEIDGKGQNQIMDMSEKEECMDMNQKDDCSEMINSKIAVKCEIRERKHSSDKMQEHEGYDMGENNENVNADRKDNTENVSVENREENTKNINVDIEENTKNVNGDREESTDNVNVDREENADNVNGDREESTENVNGDREESTENLNVDREENTENVNRDREENTENVNVDREENTENVNGDREEDNENAVNCESNEPEWKKIPDPVKCVGLYVIVSYNNSAYPGLVEDAGQSDLYVKCMHRLGKKGNNCFYWPKKLKDVCWYDYDDVLAVIPEPSKLESSYSHFKVDDEIWESIQNQM